jgi:hypothetical protein
MNRLTYSVVMPAEGRMGLALLLKSTPVRPSSSFANNTGTMRLAYPLRRLSVNADEGFGQPVGEAASAKRVRADVGDENYVPLNDGFNWKGDPNATLSGQGIPQLPPDSSGKRQAHPADSLPPVAVAQYDPATGRYVGPDGKVYTQSDLNQGSHQEKSWQNMLRPPPG